MTGQVLKILFYGDKAYLTEDRSMTFAQLGLPPIAQSFKSPAIWTIRVIRYIEDKKKIYCNIISYQNGETEFAYDQIRVADKLNSLENITFRSIDTDALLKTLAGSVAVSFTRSPESPVERHEHHYIKSEPLHKTIDEAFYIAIKNVKFNNRGVSIMFKSDAIKKPIELTIANDNIREEFDAVKNYFGNVLGTKNIHVVTKIELYGDKVIATDVSSPEINKIDESFFEKVKFEVVRSAISKKINIEFDTALFTMEEYFETFAEDQVKSTAFYEDASELLEDVLKISDSKHYNHLRFLSSKHSHEEMKLRFVQNPFSFIFLIAGENSYHILWETLHTSEATYIWHFDKDKETLSKTLDRVEQIVNMIRHQGRKTYLNLKKEPFTRIFHDYSENVAGFLKWKAELESILT